MRPFPAVEASRWPVSPAGGSKPTWSRYGRELFYEAPHGKLVVVAVQAGFVFGKPEVLFDSLAYNPRP